MLTRWTQHLKTEEDKERFRRQVLQSRDVLERLEEILKEDVQAQDASELSQRIYDLPNWDYRQAHKNGNRQVYDTVLKYLTLDQQKDN